jgi:hypothetical protein
LMNSPITRSCICSVLEKKIVRRINRFAQFIAVCRSSILAETLGYAVSFSSP